MTQPVRGRYYDQFAPGEKVISQGRTLTEADIVAFAGISADFNPIHMDERAAAAGPFGRRIAHGLLIQAMATGLAGMTGIVQDTVIAFRHLTCKFSLPVFIGDTIHLELEVTGQKWLPRLTAGNITLAFRVINQDGATVQRGEWEMLVKGRPEEG
jgi:acyl dehydratase